MGGGHFSGGGMGGAHFSGFGGGAHFSGGAHFYGAPRGFSAPHFGAGNYGGYAGTHYAAASHAAVHGGTHYVAPGGPVGRPGYVAPGGPIGRPGTPFVPGTAYFHGGRAWAGGWWHGGWWPNVWFSPGWAWYLPVLPLGYATFWWGGVPFYYWNNLYYTWSPANNGYVVTDPPPAAGAAAGDNSWDQAQGGAYESAQPYMVDPAQQGAGAAPAQPGAAPAPPPGGGTAGDVYLYPRNGQSEAQQQNDRYECHGWAVNQTGFDPTRPGAQPGSDTEYRRAMIACLDARGYSAR